MCYGKIINLWSLSKDYTKSVQIILDLNEEDEETVQIIPSRQRRNNGTQSSSQIHVYNACWTVDDLRVITVQSVPKCGGSSEVGQPTRLKVWDSMNGDLLRVIRNISDSASHCLARHPLNPLIIITAGEDGFVNVWDVDLEQIICQNRFLLDDGKPAVIVDVSLSTDGSYIAATDGLGRVSLLGLDDPAHFVGVASMYPEQYYSTDYATFILDDLGYAIDVGTQLPVNEAPVGSLCQMNGTAYAVQPKKLSGPSILVNAEVANSLAKIEQDRAVLSKEMDRVFNVFAKNKSNGRMPRRYGSVLPQLSFGLRKNKQSSTGKPHSAKPRSSNIHYIEFDLNQYQPSSDDSALDSEWERAEVEDANPTGHGHSHRPRSNIYTLSSYRAQPLRRSSRSRNYSLNYDDGDITGLLAPASRNTALTRAERAAARAQRLGRNYESVENSDALSSDEDDEGLSENGSHITLLSSDEESQNHRSSTRRKQLQRSGQSSCSGNKRRGRSLRVDANNEEAIFEERTSADDVENSLVSLSNRARRTSQRVAKIHWSQAKDGIRTIPIGITVDRAWLQMDSPNEALYCPQVGDRVVYFPQGHKQHLQNFAEDVSPPWLAFPIKWPFVECEVREVQYEFPSMQEYRYCQSVMAILTLVVIRIPLKNTISSHGQYITDLVEPRSTRHSSHKEQQIFRVTVRNSSLADFLVPSVVFLRSVHLPWHLGIRINVTYKEVTEETQELVFRQYPGRVVRLSNSDEDWPQSPWDALEMTWEDATSTGESSSMINNDSASTSDRVCPWEANPLYEGYANHLSKFQLPSLNSEDIKRIDTAIGELMEANTTRYSPFEYEVDSSVYESYYCVIPVPLYVDLIRRRLRSNYYRQMTALEFDIHRLYANCQLYNHVGSAIVQDAADLRDAILEIVFPNSSASSASAHLSNR